ncbi:MAG: alpha-amylase family protein [Tissierellaceae bacterium]
MNIKKQDREFDLLKKTYMKLYGNQGYWERLIKLMERYREERPEYLKKMDKEEANWYQKADVVGLTLYIDLFAGDIQGFIDRVWYLKELGITFIHFMPLLESRKGNSDGGYAVKDYKSIEPSLGTMEDFERLLEILRRNGIRTCIDFVINHTAKEHEWAIKAAKGIKKYENMYLIYDSDEIPKAFEQTVPQVFPETSPGNFTYYEELGKWVFTTFNEFQWDLNFKNPYVFEQIVDILLFWGNKGINVIRLDAIPFIWKTLGTSCRNLPEVHTLLFMIQKIVQYVSPSYIILGEAIVQSSEIVKYFGEDEQECQLMYNAAMMVNIWNALATRDIGLLKIDQDRFKLPSWGTWINYLRCHDDIGWGFNEEAIESMGLMPEMHKQFLINFYRGEFPGSFAKGELYQFNPQTLDARNSGTLGSLAGLEKAKLELNHDLKLLAYKRIKLIYGLLFASSGIPLIYSGDELAVLNDYSYKEDPNKSHDSRWVHRSRFDWEKAKNRNKDSSSECVIFQSLKKLIEVRKSNEIFKSSISVNTIETNNRSVYSFFKIKDKQSFVGIFNFSDKRQVINKKIFTKREIKFPKKDMITERKIDMQKDELILEPYDFFWLM